MSWLVRSVILCLLLIPLGSMSCGGKSNHDDAKHKAGADGGSQGEGGTSGGGGRGDTEVAQGGDRAGSGTAGASAGESESSACIEQPVNDVLTPIDDCQITEQPEDLSPDCQPATCPIIRILDVSCSLRPDRASLSASERGQSILLRSMQDGRWARHIDLDGEQFGVAKVSYYDHGNLVATLDSAGKPWLFGANEEGLNAIYETDKGWSRSEVIPPQDVSLLSPVDAAVVDESAAYLVYGATGLPGTPYLASRDESCWANESLTDDPVDSVIVRADREGLPWILWTTPSTSGEKSLVLRHADGTVENLGSFAMADTASSQRLELLPKGLGGTSEGPTIFVGTQNGIHQLDYAPDRDVPWIDRTLPETGVGKVTGDCPDIQQFGTDICKGLSECTEHVVGNSQGFGVARTASGQTYVAWVNYDVATTYQLNEQYVGGEMGLGYCNRTEVEGSGTARLVLGHLSESEPALTLFSFDIGSIASLDLPVAIRANGEKLFILAKLTTSSQPNLTYLEINAAFL